MHAGALHEYQMIINAINWQYAPNDDFLNVVLLFLAMAELFVFWEDSWLNGVALSIQYPILYNIGRRENVTVFDVLSHHPLTIEFCRNLVGDKWDAWLHLVERLMNISLLDDDDKFKWNLTLSGRFTVKSLYEDFMNGYTRFLQKYIWDLNVPLKIRIFMWFLHRKVLLTKDNLAKRQWNGCTKCVFCGLQESVEHFVFYLFFCKECLEIITLHLWLNSSD